MSWITIRNLERERSWKSGSSSMWRRYEAVSFKVFPLSTSSYTMYTCSLITMFTKREGQTNFFYFFLHLYLRLLREKVCLTRVSKIFRTWKRIGYRRVKIIFFIIFLFLLEIGVKKKYFHKNWNSFNSNLSFIWKGKCK